VNAQETLRRVGEARLQQVGELTDMPTPADLVGPEGSKVKIVLSKKGEVEIIGNRLGAG
jgi:hypothetical protein